ncbi:hypothetical protein LTR86_006374 [Recurvomyces mirabilis]|nr:hypothetical protein LTR86_006374 [Recurvomyces mirabilis]
MAGKRYWTSHPRIQLKTQGRPAKVLSSKKSTMKATKANQEISDKTNNRSRLMQLPPEIRNRIWKFALAGNLIHIMGVRLNGRFSTSRVRHAVCNIPHPALHSGSEDGRISTAYIVEHITCQTSMLEQKVTSINAPRGKKGRESPNERRLNLGLLQTCRQIHTEASLIPYSDNTFVFAHNNPLVLLECFVLCLALEQARAIRSLSFICAGSHGNKITKSTRRCLTNNVKDLQHLDLIFEFLDDEFDRISFNPRSVDLQAAGLEDLRDTIGGAVRVHAYNALVSGVDSVNRKTLIPADALTRWEKKLLERLGGVAESGEL